jgi:hypothetical protein
MAIGGRAMASSRSSTEPNPLGRRPIRSPGCVRDTHGLQLGECRALPSRQLPFDDEFVEHVRQPVSAALDIVHLG